MGIAELFVKWPAVPSCCVLSSLSATIVAALFVIVSKSTASTPLLVLALSTRLYLLFLCITCQINSLVCFTIVTVSVSLCLPSVSLQQHWAHISSLWCSVVIVVVSAFMSLTGGTLLDTVFVARVVWQLVLYTLEWPCLYSCTSV